MVDAIMDIVAKAHEPKGSWLAYFGKISPPESASYRRLSGELIWLLRPLIWRVPSGHEGCSGPPAQHSFVAAAKLKAVSRGLDRTSRGIRITLLPRYFLSVASMQSWTAPPARTSCVTAERAQCLRERLACRRSAARRRTEGFVANTSAMSAIVRSVGLFTPRSSWPM
jgi:hypothetical protein